MKTILALLLALAPFALHANGSVYASYGYQMNGSVLTAEAPYYTPEFSNAAYQGQNSGGFGNYDLGMDFGKNIFIINEIGIRYTGNHSATLQSQMWNAQSPSIAPSLVGEYTQTLDNQSVTLYIGYSVKPWGLFDVTARVGISDSFGNYNIHALLLNTYTYDAQYSYTAFNPLYELSARKAWDLRIATVSLEAGYTYAYDHLSAANCTFKGQVTNGPTFTQLRPASSADMDNSSFFIRVRLENLFHI